MTLQEALKAAKGEKEELAMNAFLQAVAGSQLAQYDKLFDAAIGECGELSLALQVLNSKADRLREWFRIILSDSGFAVSGRE